MRGDRSIQIKRRISFATLGSVISSTLIALTRLCHLRLALRSESGLHLSGFQESLGFNCGLPQYCAKRAFRNFARMVGHSRISVRGCVEPKFVTSGRLAIKFEAAYPKFPRHLPVFKSGQAAHSRRNYNRVIPYFTGGGQTRNAMPFSLSLD